MAILIRPGIDIVVSDPSEILEKIRKAQKARQKARLKRKQTIDEILEELGDLMETDNPNKAWDRAMRGL